jgi:hypothetical protein
MSAPVPASVPVLARPLSASGFRSRCGAVARGRRDRGARVLGAGAAWLLAAVLLLPTAACTDESRIPGTEIPDNEDNREILKVLETYRAAMIRKDAAAVLATVHDSYFDAAGTEDPSDDVSYEDLGGLLRRRMAQLEAVRFSVDYLELTVVNDRAKVYVWVDASFKMKPIVDPETGTVRVDPRATRKQDHAMFELIREGATWRITRGI